MNLKIKRIRDAGDIQKERVILQVTESTDVGNFLLIRTGYIADEPTTDVFNALWFPFLKVHAGDLVVVYTKKGVTKSKVFGAAKSHFFYWGESEAIWATSGTSAVLLHAPDWESFPVASDE